MTRISYIVFVGIFFILTPAYSVSDKNSFERKDDDLERKVRELIQRMTLEEKIGQLNQYNGFMDFTGPTPQQGASAQKYEHIKKGLVGSMLNVHGVENVRAVQRIAVEESRLGIPLIIGFDVIHGYKSISPIPLAEAASWDLEAIKRSAQIAAEEASAAGINWTFAPMVDISRDARWGRVMEGAGEDPYLGSLIARARVQGFQGEDLTLPNTIAACAKHFAAYGFAEAGRDYNTVDIGASTMHNIVLPPFKASVDAGVRTFMNGFNLLNGIPVTGDVFLQRELLKGDWGFKGFIVSDWGSISEMIQHGYASDNREAARLAFKAGCDMDMESYVYVEYLADLVRSGQIAESLIDEAASRVLRVKFELGLFDNPYKYCNTEREKNTLGSSRFHEDLIDISKKSIVLLKNENQTLPLRKSGLRLAIIGPLAADKTSPLGSWRIGAEDETAVSVFEGLKSYPSDNKITYANGVRLVNNQPTFTHHLEINLTDTTGFGNAIQTARNSDVVIMVLGEHGFHSGEGRSRVHLDLPGLQQKLLEAVYAVNKNIVLVLQNGRPLVLTWAAEHIPAIVEAWHLGSQSGHAIAQVLYGDYNPSGKLPMSFPRSVGQLPLYYNHFNTGRPVETDPGIVFWSSYTDDSNLPLYPFGFGLSYTSFSYDELDVSIIEKNPLRVKVSVNVTNTGSYAGRETVQLYLRKPYSRVVRPVRELKGFTQLELNPGETQRVSLNLSTAELGYFDQQGKWFIEDGGYEVFIGGDSRASLKGSFILD